MTISVRIHCDRTYRFSTCGGASWPARTVEEALAVAASQGWYIKPDRQLCPSCCGHKAKT